jgi:hypothetical protein
MRRQCFDILHGRNFGHRDNQTIGERVYIGI